MRTAQRRISCGVAWVSLSLAAAFHSAEKAGSDITTSKGSERVAGASYRIFIIIIRIRQEVCEEAPGPLVVEVHESSPPEGRQVRQVGGLEMATQTLYSQSDASSAGQVRQVRHATRTGPNFNKIRHRRY